MPIKAYTCHVVTCDVCGHPYETCDDYTAHFTTAPDAVAHLRRDTQWLLTCDDRAICPAQDEQHRAALDDLLPPEPVIQVDGQLPLDLGPTT